MGHQKAVYKLQLIIGSTVAQWYRVLDSRPRGHRFEPHQRRCVVSLSKTHLSIA